MMKNLLPAAALALFLFAACDDTTGTAGSEVMPEGDNVVTSTAIFNTSTRSVAAGHVLITTPHSYLGCIVDPETNAMTRSSFLAQYHVMDGLSFPDKALMLTDDDGQVACDSCELRLYFTQYYGDSLTTMKARVRELDRENIMEEGVLYYSDLNPDDYVSESPRVDMMASYSIYDPTRPTASSSSSSYYRSITIKLPVEYGAEILRAYYDNPQYFANSYEFIHNVCPGFYVENVGGVGSMLDVEFSTFDMYYSYKGTTSAGNDTTYVGLTRMAATEEVLQNTAIDTQLPEGLLDEGNPYTMVKSPAGVFTEMTLPIDEIFAGEHAKDTLNSAQLLLDRYNATESVETSFPLPAPTNILLLPKAEMAAFFEEGKLPDEATSYMATYSNGAYAFNNIARLIKSLYQNRDTSDPDWNKVLIVPVDAEYTSVTSLYTTSKMLTRLRNALSLSNVRLAGGSGTAPQVRCVYSHFE